MKTKKFNEFINEEYREGIRQGESPNDNQLFIDIPGEDIEIKYDGNELTIFTNVGMEGENRRDYSKSIEIKDAKGFLRKMVELYNHLQGPPKKLPRFDKNYRPNYGGGMFRSGFPL